jgi:hypothetical protein
MRCALAQLQRLRLRAHSPTRSSSVRAPVAGKLTIDRKEGGRMRIPGLIMTLMFALGAIAPTAHAAGQLGVPRSITPLGTFGNEGIQYNQYDGIFEGQTSTGSYRVPYRITAPAKTNQGSGTVMVEGPHAVGALGTPGHFFGREFLFSRRIAHAGVGYSTFARGIPGFEILTMRILDPMVPDTFVNGGYPDDPFPPFSNRTDPEIIADFGDALKTDPVATAQLGTVERRYLTGFSDSSVPVATIVNDGLGANAFEMAFPFVMSDYDLNGRHFDLQAALAAGRFNGKVIIIDSEAEMTRLGVDRGVAPDQFRLNVTAGTPHPCDTGDGWSPNNGNNPLCYFEATHALFLAGDKWVRNGLAPPPSTRFPRDNSLDGSTVWDGNWNDILRDANGNALVVDTQGNRVPRPPPVELGEARFITGFPGDYTNVMTLAQLGFASSREYERAFEAKMQDVIRAGLATEEDAKLQITRSKLCPGLTYTQVYRDHYANFFSLTPCGS